MKKNGLRTCCVCHKEYSFCLCNPEDRLKPTWHFAYCSENCRDIYAVTSAYEDGDINSIEARKRLESLDLSKKDNFGESYRNSISSIMNTKVQTNKKENEKNSGKTVNKNIITKGEENTESNVE